jgi:hypothetical protein
VPERSAAWAERARRAEARQIVAKARRVFMVELWGWARGLGTSASAPDEGGMGAARPPGDKLWAKDW